MPLSAPTAALLLLLTKGLHLVAAPPAPAGPPACTAGSRNAVCTSIAAPYCPWKGVDLNHSGSSPFIGPSSLSQPAWVFEEPNRREKPNGMFKVFHSSPVIDGELNIYIQSTTGFVYSLDKTGRLRWEFATSAGNPANLAFSDGVLFTVCEDGIAFAIDADTGAERWRTQIADSAPADVHSLVVHGGIVLSACNPSVHYQETGRLRQTMSEAVCAFNALDGSLRWTYDMVSYSQTHPALACNQVQAVVGDTVIFADIIGGVYAASLGDGSPRWQVPGIADYEELTSKPYGTTAHMVVGPSDLLYHAYNLGNSVGIVSAHSVHDGSIAWTRTFDVEVNVAPSVGRLHDGTLAVVVALGSNIKSTPLHWSERFLRWIHGVAGRQDRAVALDAMKGHIIWTFTTPAYDGRVAGSYYDTSGDGNYCSPVVWGSPAIGADGTVYLNWSGGSAFAIRDANGDGAVELDDPAEVSRYHHGFGSNGETAIAPGMAVVPSCRLLLAFLA